MLADGSGLNCNVLVLNRNYVAIRVIRAQRAFRLMFRDLAEVIHVDDDLYANYCFSDWLEWSELAHKCEPQAHDWVRTVTRDIAVPRIVRLMGFDRVPRQTIKLNRRNVYARDHNHCQYCGSLFSNSELSMDHVIPRSHGGRTTWDNIVAACIPCNTKKGDRTPEQASMRLLRRPAKPLAHPIIRIKLNDGRYAS